MLKNKMNPSTANQKSLMDLPVHVLELILVKACQDNPKSFWRLTEVSKQFHLIIANMLSRNEIKGSKIAKLMFHFALNKDTYLEEITRISTVNNVINYDYQFFMRQWLAWNEICWKRNLPIVQEPSTLVRKPYQYCKRNGNVMIVFDGVTGMLSMQCPYMMTVHAKTDVDPGRYDGRLKFPIARLIFFRSEEFTRKQRALAKMDIHIGWDLILIRKNMYDFVFKVIEVGNGKVVFRVDKSGYGAIIFRLDNIKIKRPWINKNDEGINTEQWLTQVNYCHFEYDDFNDVRSKAYDISCKSFARDINEESYKCDCTIWYEFDCIYDELRFSYQGRIKFRISPKEPDVILVQVSDIQNRKKITKIYPKEVLNSAVTCIFVYHKTIFFGTENGRVFGYRIPSLEGLLTIDWYDYFWIGGAPESEPIRNIDFEFSPSRKQENFAITASTDNYCMMWIIE